MERKGSNIRILRESIPEDKYKSNDDYIVFCTCISPYKCSVVIQLLFNCVSVEAVFVTNCVNYLYNSHASTVFSLNIA